MLRHYCPTRSTLRTFGGCAGAFAGFTGAVAASPSLLRISSVTPPCLIHWFSMGW